MTFSTPGPEEYPDYDPDNDPEPPPRARLLVATLLAGLLIVLAGTVWFWRAGDDIDDPGWRVQPPTPTAPAPASSSRPVVALPQVQADLPAGARMAWAMGDPATGKVIGPAAGGFSTTIESVAKVWLVGQYLQHHPGDPDADAVAAIVDSDDAAAERIYRSLGADASTTAMLNRCGMSGTVQSGWWSITPTTAADLVKLGLCVKRGAVAGARTDDLLTLMHQVRGEGAFGAPAVFDGAAYKNGWTLHPDGWHVNCLTLTSAAVYAVTVIYPSGLALAFGAGVCTTVMQQLSVAGPPGLPEGTR